MINAGRFFFLAMFQEAARQSGFGVTTKVLGALIMGIAFLALGVYILMKRKKR